MRLFYFFVTKIVYSKFFVCSIYFYEFSTLDFFNLTYFFKYNQMSN